MGSLTGALFGLGNGLCACHADCLQEESIPQGADFLTYAHHFIGNALLTCQMQEEAVPLKMWMSTRLCVELHGSTINPASLSRRQSRICPEKRLPRRPQRGFDIG